MLRTYELVIAVSTAKPMDEKAVKEQIKKQAGEDVTMASVTDFGKRTLAYPIQKQKEAQYWLVTFSSTGTGITTLTKKLQQDENILRFLVVKQDA